MSRNTGDGDIPVRRIVRQGALVKVLRTDPKRYAGGGKRKKQHGHGKRSERRLFEFLLTCRPAKRVIWLTYPHIQGPKNVEKNARALLKRIEKHYGFSIGALIKMEVQQRLAPELTMLVWYNSETDLEAAVVESLWSKVIKADARIKLEPPRDWVKLASYVSKRVSVTYTTIEVGSERHAIIEPPSTDFIKRAHNPSNILVCFPDDGHAVHAMEFAQVKREWVDYDGRYCWRYGRKSIQRYPKILKSAPGILIAPVRAGINSTRTMHFVGEDDHITLRGEDALRAAKSLGIPLEPRLCLPPNVWPLPHHLMNLMDPMYREVMNVLCRSG